MFWYGTAIAYVVGMHIFICTILCSVFGQGLAIRGPIGSMVHAVDGMVQEQRSIVFFFGVLCVAFNISIIGLFGTMLDEVNALICSAIFTGGLYMWYHYSLRIYNRFQYKGFFHINYEKDNQLDDFDTMAGQNRHGNEGRKTAIRASKSKIKFKLWSFGGRTKQQRRSLNDSIDDPTDTLDDDLLSDIGPDGGIGVGGSVVRSSIHNLNTRTNRSFSDQSSNSGGIALCG
jgi:hypothetical protein